MSADAGRLDRQRSGNRPAAGGAQMLSRSEALAATLPPLLVAADRVAATVSQGVHGRRRVGDGETFWQFRRYQSGDSAQRIDWRQSAKTDRVYVRENEWEAAQIVWLWRDGSASMRWRSTRDRPTKLERAELLLLALASLLARGGEHLALLGQSGPPSPGRSTLRRMAAVLERSEAPGASLPEPKPLPRYGRLILFGDFLSAVEEIQKIVTAYARRGVRGHLMQILDPAEETLPFSGRVLFEGSEQEGQVLFGRAETVRDEYRRALELHRSRLSDIVRSASWTLLTHRTDHPPEAALLSLYVALAGSGRI